MSADLANKIAVVTGGGRGLGLGIAHELASRGATVALTGRHIADLDKGVAEIVAAGGQASAHPGDVGSAADVDAAVASVVARHGRIDILVNNAGIADEAAFLDISEENWNRVIGINLTGVFLMSQRVARRMVADRISGAIVNIGSIEAHGADGPFASYVATKFAIRGLTMSVAIELAGAGIRVNSVSPGWVHTQMAEDTLRPAMLHHMLHDFGRVPLRRMVTIKEVASAVAFLSGPGASGITGTDLLVDAGTLADIHVHRTLPDDGDAK